MTAKASTKSLDVQKGAMDMQFHMESTAGPDLVDTNDPQIFDLLQRQRRLSEEEQIVLASDPAVASRREARYPLRDNDIKGRLCMLSRVSRRPDVTHVEQVDTEIMHLMREQQHLSQQMCVVPQHFPTVDEIFLQAQREMLRFRLIFESVKAGGLT